MYFNIRLHMFTHHFRICPIAFRSSRLTAPIHIPDFQSWDVRSRRVSWTMSHSHSHWKIQDVPRCSKMFQDVPSVQFKGQLLLHNLHTRLRTGTAKFTKSTDATDAARSSKELSRWRRLLWQPQDPQEHDRKKLNKWTFEYYSNINKYFRLLWEQFSLARLAI